MKEFWANKTTKKYLDSPAETLGISPEYLKQARTGRNGGAWTRLKLAVLFARWLDVKLSTWCDAVIDDIPNKRDDLTIIKSAKSAAMRVSQSFPKALRLADELAERDEWRPAPSATRSKS